MIDEGANGPPVLSSSILSTNYLIKLVKLVQNTDRDLSPMINDFVQTLDKILAFSLSSRAHSVYRSTLGGPALTIVPWYPPSPQKKIVLLLNIIISFTFGLKSGPQGVQIFAFPRLTIAT
jgi:hypothetical protein